MYWLKQTKAKQQHGRSTYSMLNTMFSFHWSTSMMLSVSNVIVHPKNLTWQELRNRIVGSVAGGLLLCFGCGMTCYCTLPHTEARRAAPTAAVKVSLVAGASLVRVTGLQSSDSQQVVFAVYSRPSRVSVTVELQVTLEGKQPWELMAVKLGRLLKAAEKWFVLDWGEKQRCSLCVINTMVQIYILNST